MHWWGGLGEQTALPAQGGVLQDVGSSGPYPGVGAAQPARARGVGAARRDRDRTGEPVTATGRPAAGGSGDDPQGGLGGLLLGDEPPGVRAAGGRARDLDRSVVRAGRAARGPAYVLSRGGRPVGSASAPACGMTASATAGRR